MMENNNMDTNLETNVDSQQDQQQEQKLFSQEEVERIIKTRLERDRLKRNDTRSEELAQKEKAFAEREQAFTARESRLNCMEYCYKNGYDIDLIDILDTSDPEKFAEKVKRVSGLKMFSQYVAPAASCEPVGNGTDPMSAAFSPNQKHTPKSWPPEFDY